MLARSTLVWLLLALPAGAAAQSALQGMGPDRATARRERAARLEAELGDTLARLPGAQAAHVHIALPATERVPLDAPLPPVTAAVVIEGTDVDEAQVRKLVVAAVADLGPGQVQIRTTAPQPVNAAPALTHVGPFEVTAESAPLLRGALAALLAAQAALAAFVLRRRRPS